MSLSCADVSQRYLRDLPHIEDKFGGTPAYMSPERLMQLDDVDGQKADVYSMGTILWELVTFRTPFLRIPRVSKRRLTVESQDSLANSLRTEHSRLDDCSSGVFSRPSLSRGNSTDIEMTALFDEVRLEGGMTQQMQRALCVLILRPPLPRGCPNLYRDLIAQCWSHRVENRPSIVQMYNVLTSPEMTSVRWPKLPLTI